MAQEEIWTLDYEGNGAMLKQAMTKFLPELQKNPQIQRMRVLFEKENPNRMRVEIVSSGDPFNPPWPGAFADTQIGQPKVFLSEPELSIARK